MWVELMKTSASIFAVLIHSPVKFSGNKHVGTTVADRTGFNLILSGAYDIEKQF